MFEWGKPGQIDGGGIHGRQSAPKHNSFVLLQTRTYVDTIFAHCVLGYFGIEQKGFISTGHRDDAG